MAGSDQEQGPQKPSEQRGGTTPDRFFTPIDHPEIWLKQGDATIYFAPPP